MVGNIEVIGLGALNIDHLYLVERILEDGETVVKETVSAPGGSAANTIYGLAKLGVKTGFSGVVGNDAEGKILLKDFQAVRVDTRRIRVKPQARTGSVICLSDSSGRRSLYVLPGANTQLSLDDLDLAYIKGAQILHLSSFADESQFKLSLELATRLDPSVKISFAPGALYVTRGLKALAAILARAEVLFLNRHEIEQLTGKDFVAGAESCLNEGCQVIAVTLGKGGPLKSGIATSYIRDNQQEYMVEAVSKELALSVDTTGAGDAFAAGFLYGLLKGKGMEESGRLGDIIAQFSVTRIGARAALPTLPELSRRYRELYNQEL